MSFFEARIAWRYLRARRKTVVISVVTAISVLGVTVGTAALVVALALLTGFQEDVRDRILAANAHLLVYGTYIGTPWHGWREPLEWLYSQPETASATPLVMESGLAVSQFSQAPVLLRGVDPGREGAAPPGRMDGTTLQALAEDTGDGERGIILGTRLASSLGVGSGSQIRILTAKPTLTPFGPAPVSRKFRVLGTFDTGFHEYDNGWALISLETAQRLFGEEGAVTAIQVQVSPLEQVEDLAARLRAAFPADVDALTWMEMNRPLFSAFKLEKLLMFLSIGLIIVVGALNIGALLVMGVMEKTRDIGTLRALGASARSVRRVFVFQGLAIGLIGTFLGCMLGFGLCWTLDSLQAIRLDPQVYFIEYLPFRVKPLEFAAVASVAILVSWLASLYPAWKAARLDPARALRYE